jgi:hypothetical protein
MKFLFVLLMSVLCMAVPLAADTGPPTQYEIVQTMEQATQVTFEVELNVSTTEFAFYVQLNPDFFLSNIVTMTEPNDARYRVLPVVSSFINTSTTTTVHNNTGFSSGGLAGL